MGSIINSQNIAVMIRILVVAFITILTARIVNKIYNKGKNTHGQLFRRFIYNIVRATIYLVGIIAGISQIPQLGALTQTILAGSGILALAISLSAQESLNNILSAMFIAIFKPFEVGDRVTLVTNNITGIIEDITLRHTVVKTFTNTRVVIPNSTMNKEVIENSNLNDVTASSFIDIGVAYESNIERAMEIMAGIIGEHPLYLDTRTEEEKAEGKPKVKVFVRELGSSAVMLRANMWTSNVSENFEACSDIRLSLKKAFDKEGIEIPYNKYIIINN